MFRADEITTTCAMRMSETASITHMDHFKKKESLDGRSFPPIHPPPASESITPPPSSATTNSEYPASHIVFPPIAIDIEFAKPS